MSRPKRIPNYLRTAVSTEGTADVALVDHVVAVDELEELTKHTKKFYELTGTPVAPGEGVHTLRRHVDAEIPKLLVKIRKLHKERFQADQAAIPKASVEDLLGRVSNLKDLGITIAEPQLAEYSRINDINTQITKIGQRRIELQRSG